MRTKLRTRRKELNLTQQEVADKVGIHRATYTNIENGKANPSFKTMQKIKKALNTEKDDIFLTKNVQKMNKSA
ncbi:MAG: helix-turn-helix transcriptional regulator [Firmicutes bacterium]|nr:helix-turn-helix transcriptional regulator [Bacillota bacterium]